MRYYQDIMGPEHPLWQEFRQELASNNACSAYHHSTQGTEHVLQEMDLDVEQSLGHLNQQGGDCDCTISTLETGCQHQDGEDEETLEEAESEI